MSSVTPSPLPDRDDRLYLRDMVEFCERVAACSYLGIEPDTVWLIVCESVPTLLTQLRVMLAALPPAI